MRRLLNWLARRKVKECSEEMENRLTDPLTTNVVYLRLVDPATVKREDFGDKIRVTSTPIGPSPIHRKFKESRTSLIFDEPPLTDREKELWSRIVKTTEGEDG